MLDSYRQFIYRMETTKMTTQELIEALDQRYGNPNAKGLELIQEAIKVLRLQQEELKALMEQVK